MDSEVPTLEVGFAIGTGASFDELMRLQQVMDSTEGKVVAEAARIERATSGMVKLDGATAQITAFGNSASRELQSVARETNRAEKAGEAMIRQLQQQAETFGKTASEIRQMRAEMRAVEAENRGLTDLADRLRGASAEMARLERGTGQTMGTARLAGHHMQNLAFQFQDLGVQMFAAAGSTAPLKMAFTALMQQGSQISGVMMAAGVGFGQMAKQVAGAVVGFAAAHPILLGIAAAAGVAYGAFKLFQSSVAQSGELDRFRDSLGLTKDELEKLGPVGITATDVFKGLWKTIDEGLGLSPVFASIKSWASDTFMAALNYGKAAVAGIYGGFYGAYTGIAQIWKTFPAIIGEAATNAANFAIGAMETMINKAISALNWLATQINSIPGMQGMGLQIGKIAPVSLGRVEQQYAGAGSAAIGAFVKGAQQGYAEAQSGLSTLGSKIADNIVGAAKDRIGKAAKDLIDDRTIKKTKANTDALREQLRVEKLLDEMRIETARNMDKLEAAMIKRQRQWGKEIDFNKQMLQEDQARYDLKQQDIAANETLLNLNLQQLATVEQLGGLAGKAAGLVGAFQTGNFSRINGKAGNLLQGVSSLVGDNGWKAVTDKLDNIFGGRGMFSLTMAKVLTAAATGSAAGGIFSDLTGTKGSSLGGSIGGAIGEKVGEKFLSKGMESIAKGLGDFAGPLGSIAGGILGSVIGGLFTKVKWGSVNVSNQGVSEAAGNSSSFQRAALSTGNSVFGSLQDIADAFGGTVGDFGNIAVGVRHGDYRVNLNGTSLKKAKGATDFNDDAEAAIAFAIQSAIERGAIDGIRAGTQKLLKATDDLQANLKKAVSFEGVFSELKSITDPVGFAIDSLDKQFAQLRTIFAEAGASAGEYADLEQLYQLKKIDAVKQANSKADELGRDRRTLEARVLELQGKSFASVAMLRQIEIEQMDASLQPLQRRVWAMEDATAVIEQMQPLVDSLKAYRDTLFGQQDGALSYRAAMVKLMSTGALAAAGDASALGALQGVGQDFLTAAKNNASSLAQYNRDVALVARYVDGGVAAAQKQIDYAKLTLDAQNATVTLLSSIDTQLGGDASSTLAAAAQAASVSTSSGATTSDMAAEIAALRAELAGLRSDNNAGHAATASNTGAIKQTLANVTSSSGGDAIATVPAA